MNAGKVGLVGAALTMTAINQAPHSTGSFEEMPPTTPGYVHTYHQQLHHVEQHLAQRGLDCQVNRRQNNEIPAAIVQHRMVDQGNKDLGAKSMASYTLDQALKQSDFAHGGKNATHWTDAFCYSHE